MGVDVATEIEIRRPRDEVSAFAADPANATAWYKNIHGGRVGDATSRWRRFEAAIPCPVSGEDAGIHLRGSRV
jgi:hypothetical protein